MQLCIWECASDWRGVRVYSRRYCVWVLRTTITCVLAAEAREGGGVTAAPPGRARDRRDRQQRQWRVHAWPPALQGARAGRGIAQADPQDARDAAAGDRAHAASGRWMGGGICVPVIGMLRGYVPARLCASGRA
eukprot:2305609-Pleurochrysis_carterae.AAC.4